MEETMEKAPKTLGTMLDYLGLDASVKSEEKNGNIVLTVFSEDAGRIIGRKGVALHSLQLLLNRIISRGNRNYPKIMIDVDGYRKPRHSMDRRPRRDNRDSRRDGGGNSSAEKEEQVRKQALDAAKEAKRWGEAVTLPPMNGKDRRIVHLTLEEDTKIVTESITPENATGSYKSIIVSVKH